MANNRYKTFLLLKLTDIRYFHQCSVMCFLWNVLIIKAIWILFQSFGPCRAHVGKMSASEKMRCIWNVTSHWPRHCSCDQKNKYIKTTQVIVRITDFGFPYRSAYPMIHLTPCGLVMPNENIDLGQRWPDGTELLPAPMLTYHQWDSGSLSQKSNCTESARDINSPNEYDKYTCKITTTVFTWPKNALKWFKLCWLGSLLSVLISSIMLHDSRNPLWPSDSIKQHSSGSTLDWRHQAITWTNVNLSSVWFWDTHLKPTAQQVLKMSIRQMSRKNTFGIFKTASPRGQWIDIFPD